MAFTIMHPYFKNPLVSLYYSRDASVGMAVWRGHVHGAAFREAILLCLELMSRFELRGWLSDNRKIRAINLQDLQWSLKVIDTRIAAIPLLRLARLPSDVEEVRSAVTAVLLDAELVSAGKGLFCNFGEVREAMQWLTDQTTSKEGDA
ncbi:hypothetical protein I2I11_06910 [Pontibacter sp. 172403-2]|uniref:hypothetical protein n=1 Tax=Pontibacter rufus TaxID=2791028 RepID=UPI0018AFA57A|nr:hypothetical protein [Pontibacter sp. 172403-2]MBF9253015.1 hypothetical protein [Pontibacter sp. 172403-2]